MPAPSQLTIATSAVIRLLKEELSYHKELVDQEAKVKILEEKIKAGQASEDGNDEFMLKQQVSLQSTVFPLLLSFFSLSAFPPSLSSILYRFFCEFGSGIF